MRIWRGLYDHILFQRTFCYYVLKDLVFRISDGVRFASERFLHGHTYTQVSFTETPFGLEASSGNLPNSLCTIPVCIVFKIVRLYIYEYIKSILSPVDMSDIYSMADYIDYRLHRMIPLLYSHAWLKGVEYLGRLGSSCDKIAHFDIIFHMIFQIT